MVSGASKLTAKQVVVANVPSTLRRISFSPPLPASRDQLLQKMLLGSEGKAIAIYTSPFWRASGLNGQALSSQSVVRTTFDKSPADGSSGSITGLIEADQMRLLCGASDHTIITSITRDYVFALDKRRQKRRSGSFKAGTMRTVQEWPCSPGRNWCSD